MSRRGLFVTHDVGPYGASRSLQLLLRNFDRDPFDLAVIYQKHDVAEAELRATFGPQVGRIERYHLPHAYCYQGRPESLPELYWKKWSRWLKWQFNSGRFQAMLAARRYNFIHLNSLVLHPLISETEPYIIHVREILADDAGPAASRSLAKAHGVIFIDEATQRPFRDLPLRNWTILNNPIDMEPVAHATPPDLAPLGIDPARDTIFAMIGRVTANKGVDFVIRNFHLLADPHVRLLIVGDGSAEFLAHCRQLAGDDRRIVFWGEERDIDRIFRVVDYVVRGEDRPCIGRTMYEGLYAGCGVILPGGEADGGIFEYARFRERIGFYPPRDAAALVRVLQQAAGHKPADRHFLSNIQTYVEQFHEFVARVARP